MVAQCFVHLAHPLRIQGNVIEAHLPGTRIGEICEIEKSLLEPEVVGFAQVIGFNKEHTLLSLLNDNNGFSRDNVLLPTGKPFRVAVSERTLGAILDATGTIQGRLDGGPVAAPTGGENLETGGVPRDFTQRKPIAVPLATGVRAIDGLLTCGQGQRMGIFAAAGCGKTSLMSMIIEHSEADIYVIGLIGERGREVTEFVEELRRSSRRSKVVLVYATSDRSCVERCNAAQVASTVAEYFCEQGKNVLLFIDSVTRYARALRDVALSMGELPARRGYPASVFEALPKLLERPGRFLTGSISAFYTVLIENEEESDVIGDEVRSILDGHIYLSKKLAAKGHYPAIDVLQSISRVFQQVTQPEHQQLATHFRDYLVRQNDMQLFIDLGEYKRGENEDNDAAFDKKSAMEAFLKQRMAEQTDIKTCLESLDGCLA
ncbi:type III secretion system ATPase SctN [Erwinia amylovora]|uniref:Flagellum-specific ATP synthase n=4 Tax=Erwinia amylovora TaxID=552 RepID=A0A830ZZH6_ERWAM|nr:type III secretion system ATPase SctN [Erwinia amylovora]CBX79634.1 Type III secretion system ATPase SpaI/InvC [Erwinia amylovora ATCC BAA-2158]CDK14362.1 Type III secretion system ATPase SpaI/InvC [Erwinia amylovora LA635]CDK17729.1 Type III secretion system ATPase SpaI/InvC [Erwinia amylovora LA636]CDK21098.1 Type III secretion system ATPase SpaI/InvC [Erwinia amylovora LA637]ATZ12426.1 EscN/YscN/HrcN family type III secretion system ATPase [Erwinia amylovora]